MLFLYISLPLLPDSNVKVPRLDFRRLPGPVFDPPSFVGMSAGSFSRTAAGNQAYKVPKFTFCRGREHKTTTFFSFPELWYSPLEFNSKNICQHLTK